MKDKFAINLVNEIIDRESLVANYEEDDYISGVIRGLHELSEAIQAEYDKLCPELIYFRVNSFEWFTISANGQTTFYKTEPQRGFNSWINHDNGVEGLIIPIPIGLDWRLCVWSIDDAKRIWSE